MPTHGAAVPEEEQSRVKEALAALSREALLANPLMSFDKLLLVQRGDKCPNLGLPYNWQSNSCLPKTGYDDRIAVLVTRPPRRRAGTLYRPEGGRFVGDVELHFDADRMLFSMTGRNGRWQVFEIDADGTGLRQVTGEQPDVDNYDACYLPNGRIMFASTACFRRALRGGSSTRGQPVRDGRRRPEHPPALLRPGPRLVSHGVEQRPRALYALGIHRLRRTAFTRLLFHMNPDGTEQMAYYGSNSYWPNSIFYARPIPGHPTKFVA